MSLRKLLAAFLVFMGSSAPSVTVAQGLELHLTFDSEDNFTVDASGNGRDAEIGDEAGVLVDAGPSWVNDPQRGGVLEFPGSTNGYLFAEIPELADGEFTIALWAYRDPTLCCGAGGANDGLFQVEADGGDLLPNLTKVIGGWVQKSDAAVWGRVIPADGTALSLDKTSYIMDDETWTHFAYRAHDGEFEVLVNGESGSGPVLGFDGSLLPHDTIFIGRQGTETWGGLLDDFRVYSRALSEEEIREVMTGGGGEVGALGDFNNDSVLDAADIDVLTSQVRGGQFDAKFDLDNNAAVNDEDRRIWVEDLKNTYFGDATLDGEFNSGDFVAAFTAGQYEDALPGNSTWATGDWDGDGDFASGDFVKAFQAGGYEAGPRPSVAAVPEPATSLLAWLGMWAIGSRYRRQAS